MFYRLLAEVVGHWEAVQRQARVRTNGVAGEQRHQDGFHHDHGNVLPDAGAGARSERLEETARSLRRTKREETLGEAHSVPPCQTVHVQ